MAKKKAKAKRVKAEGDAPVTTREQQNGVTRPAADNKCGQVWAALDALKEAGTEIKFDVLRPTIDKDVADATVRTQWARWRKFHG